MALIGGISSPPVQAGSSPAATPSSLAAMVAQAKAKVAELGTEVQTAREQISHDQASSAQERAELASLVADEYQQGTSSGLLALLASPDFNSALDTEISMDQLGQSERQLITELAANISDERSTEAELVKEQQQEEATEARLQAEEVVAEYEAEQAAAAQAAAAAAAKARAQATPAAPIPSPPPGPAPSPPAPPAPTGTGGPFALDTNLTLPSGITLGQIQAFLSGTPLEADSSYFIQAEQNSHVSAIYLVSDAVLETGWGQTSCIYPSKHNLFGLEAYDSNPCGDAMSFPSDQACIAYDGNFIYNDYLVPSGPYYHGPTVQGIGVDYASDSSWAAKIVQIGDDLQAV